MKDFSIYSNVKTDRDFLASTGVNKTDFLMLLCEFEQIESQIRTSFPSCTKAEHDTTLPSYDTTLPSVEILDSPEIRLFFVLFYLKNDPTWDLMGLIFSMDASTAHRSFERLLPLLRQVLALEGVLPARDAEGLALKMEEVLLIDVTERPIERPKVLEKQKIHYSGKKKLTP